MNMAAPSLPGAREAESRQLLDTVAAVAADPDGYKARLTSLDAAQAKALERETAARAAERDAKDALAALQQEQQSVESSRARLKAEVERAHDELKRSRAKLDADTLARTRALDERSTDLDVRAGSIRAKEDELDRALAACATERAQLAVAQEDAAKVKTELDKAVAAAVAREDAAKRAIDRVKALASEG